LDFNGLLSKILGVVVMFAIFATGQNVAKRISNKLPMIDTQIDPIYATTVDTGFKKRVM
jgi:hypothetical protein